MFTDFGIFPNAASSCGSLTSKSCISPSITISFRHSRPIWLWSLSLLQDHIRSLGPAFPESAFTIMIRGRTLCESTDLVNLATEREAIMKWFEALLLTVTENFMQFEWVWTSFISIPVTFLKNLHHLMTSSLSRKFSPRWGCGKINDFKFFYLREDFKFVFLSRVVQNQSIFSLKKPSHSPSFETSRKVTQSRPCI